MRWVVPSLTSTCSTGSPMRWDRRERLRRVPPPMPWWPPTSTWWGRAPISALAGLAAYESQASAIASSKADGLRRWYELDATGTAFWDVHATMDADHAEWATDALDQAGADPGQVERSARRAADAWWALLDEREAAAPSSAQLGSHH